MRLSSYQKACLYGLILGDGYLQKTGKNNARLRIEHSYNQKEYVHWKYEQFKNIFASKPKKIARKHPKSKQIYYYLRLQSHSSPVFGKLRKILYDNDSGERRIVPELASLLKSGLTLAVWYMDDGFWYERDKSAHIYVPKFTQKEMKQLVSILGEQYGIKPKWYCRPDRKGCQLNFTGYEKDALFRIIQPYIIPYFNYKLPLTP